MTRLLFVAPVLLLAALDEETGKIVGDSAFSLDLESGVRTALTSPNGPGNANETGTYKRSRYVPGESSFVLVNGLRARERLSRSMTAGRSEA
jgi:hypothetical protein